MQTHILKGEYESRQVWLDGKLLTPEESQQIINHSPDGFAWGYSVSGSAQLALAVVLKLTGEPIGYQYFKSTIISILPKSDFTVTFPTPFYSATKKRALENPFMIKETGEIVDVTPANGSEFTLKELQEYVRGYIELVPLGKRNEDIYMVVNEEGSIAGKDEYKINMKATNLLRKLVNTRRTVDIYGNALFCSRNLIK